MFLTSQVGQKAAPRVLRVAYSLDVSTWDPAMAGGTDIKETNIANYIVYETLTVFDEAGNNKPNLAESWTVSPDGLLYTFKLRKGVQFHDGSPFNAAAAKFTFDRLLDEKVTVPHRATSGMTMVKNVEVLDDYTIAIQMKAAFASFIRNTALGPMSMMSPSAVKAMGEKIRDEAVGTGAFQLVQRVRGEKFVLKRFDGYWGQKPWLETIEFRVVPDASSRLAMLMAGDVDIISSPSGPDIPSVLNNQNLRLFKAPATRVGYLTINTKVKPYDDIRVRQAVELAIDTPRLMKQVMFGVPREIETHGLPSVVFGYKPGQKPEYNPDKARKLLADAGYPNGFKTNLYSASGVDFMDVQIVSAVQAMLREVGIDVELVTSDWPTFVSAVRKPLNTTKVHLSFITWGAINLDADRVLYTQWHSSAQPPAGWNYAYIINPRLDKLLDDTRTVVDMDQRKAMYGESLDIIAASKARVYLYQLDLFLATSNKVQNLKALPCEWVDFRYVTLSSGTAQALIPSVVTSSTSSKVPVEIDVASMLHK